MKAMNGLAFSNSAAFAYPACTLYSNRSGQESLACCLLIHSWTQRNHNIETSNLKRLVQPPNRPAKRPSQSSESEISMVPSTELGGQQPTWPQHVVTDAAAPLAKTKSAWATGCLKSSAPEKHDFFVLFRQPETPSEGEKREKILRLKQDGASKWDRFSMCLVQKVYSTTQIATLAQKLLIDSHSTTAKGREVSCRKFKMAGWLSTWSSGAKWRSSLFKSGLCPRSPLSFGTFWGLLGRNPCKKEVKVFKAFWFLLPRVIYQLFTGDSLFLTRPPILSIEVLTICHSMRASNLSPSSSSLWGVHARENHQKRVTHLLRWNNQSKCQKKMSLTEGEEPWGCDQNQPATAGDSTAIPFWNSKLSSLSSGSSVKTETTSLADAVGKAFIALCPHKAQNLKSLHRSSKGGARVAWLPKKSKRAALYRHHLNLFGTNCHVERNWHVWAACSNEAIHASSVDGRPECAARWATMPETFWSHERLPTHPIPN